MGNFERIARNSVMMSLAKVIELATGFLLLAIIARYLGPALLGDYLYVKALVGLALGFTYFGLQEIIIREIAKDRANTSKYLGASLLIRSSLSIIVICALIVIDIFYDTESRLVTAIYIVLFAEIFLYYFKIFVSVFKGFEKMGYETFLQLLHSIVLFSLTLLIVYLDLGFIWLFAATATANFFQLALGIYLCHTRFARPLFDINIQLCKYLVRNCVAVGIAGFFMLAIFRIDVIILKALQSTADVAFFNVPYAIVMQIGTLPLIFTSALFPVLSSLSGSNDLHKISFAYKKVLKFFLIFTLPLSVFGTILGRNIIIIAFGQDFIPAVVSFQILIWALNFLFIDVLAQHVLIALTKQKYFAITAFWGFITNVGLALILIPKYSYVGASVATVITYFITSLISFYYLSRELGHINFNFKEIIVRPVLCAFILFGVLYMLKGMDINLITATLLGVLAYGVALLLLKAIVAEEVNILKDIIKI